MVGYIDLQKITKHKSSHQDAGGHPYHQSYRQQSAAIKKTNKKKTTNKQKNRGHPDMQATISSVVPYTNKVYIKDISYIYLFM